MLFIRPQDVTETKLLSSNILEVEPSAWSSGTTYAAGSQALVVSGSTRTVYRSLVDGNLNHAPATSTDYWAPDGTTYAAWSGATTYGVGDRVFSAATHRVYESLAAGNLNHNPTDPANILYWLDVAPTNRWAMFDSYNATQTVHPYAIDFTVDVEGRVDSLALLNLTNAISVQIVVTTEDGEVVLDRTSSLISTAGISDWFTYFFEDLAQYETFYQSDLPMYRNPTIRVRVEGNGSPVGIGIFSMGMSKYLGATLHDGAQVGIIDYSRKETDEFGNYTIVKRAFSKRGSFQTRIKKSAVDSVQSILAAYRTVPAVYLATTEYDATLFFGIFREFNIEIDRPQESLVSIEIEGLT